MIGIDALIVPGFLYVYLYNITLLTF